MKMKNVPNILEKLLLLILPPEDRESLIGDFGEIYDRKRMEQSIFAALYWYILHIIKLIRIDSKRFRQYNVCPISIIVVKTFIF